MPAHSDQPNEEDLDCQANLHMPELESDEDTDMEWFNRRFCEPDPDSDDDHDYHRHWDHDEPQAPSASWGRPGSSHHDEWHSDHCDRQQLDAHFEEPSSSWEHGDEAEDRAHYDDPHDRHWHPEEEADGDHEHREEDRVDCDADDRPRVIVTHIFSQVLFPYSLVDEVRLKDARFVHYPSLGLHQDGLNDQLAWQPVQDTLDDYLIGAALWTPPSSTYRSVADDTLPALRGAGKAFYGLKERVSTPRTLSSLSRRTWRGTERLRALFVSAHAEDLGP